MVAKVEDVDVTLALELARLVGSAGVLYSERCTCGLGHAEPPK
jgi:hypothetical protein